VKGIKQNAAQIEIMYTCDPFFYFYARFVMQLKLPLSFIDFNCI